MNKNQLIVIVFISNTLLLSLLILLGAFSRQDSFVGDGVDLLGRFNKNLEADWSGTGIRFQTKASSSTISISLSFVNIAASSDLYIGVEVNCKETKKFPINATSQSLYFEHPTEIGKTYEFTLRKITEPIKGMMQLGKLAIKGGNIITARQLICPPTRYKMLSIGDSITCAFGVDHLDPCMYSTATEDVRHGYAFLVAKEIEAEIHTIAWSGTGVIRNYGDLHHHSAEPFPIHYNRTIASRKVLRKEDGENENYWEPVQFMPDLITIMLGTNDYSLPLFPTDEEYITGLINFITLIKSDYPSAKIAVICSPISKELPQCTNILHATNITKTYFIDIPESVFSGGHGCQGHPSRQTQRNIAESMLPEIRNMLGI